MSHTCSHSMLLNSIRADAYKFYIGQARPKIGRQRESLLEALVCFILRDSTPAKGSVTQDVDNFVVELARLKLAGTQDVNRMMQPTVRDSVKQSSNLTASSASPSAVFSPTKSVQKKGAASVDRTTSNVSTSRAASPVKKVTTEPINIEDSSSDSEPVIPLGKTRSKAPMLSKCITSD